MITPATGQPIPERPAGPGRGSSKAAVILILVGIIVYFNSLAGQLVFDDLLWIANNPRLNSPAEFVASMSGRWVIALTILLNYNLGGLSVTGFHVLNVAIHIAAAMTLFGIVRRALLLTKWQGRFEQSASWLALAVALVWMAHPLQTQAVTYVIQRCESLMGLFYLLTLYCVLRGATVPEGGRSWPWYAGAVVSCLLGMGSKEVMVTAPVVVLLFDWIFLSRSVGALLRRRWLLYVLLAGTWLQVAGHVVSIVLPPPAPEPNTEASTSGLVVGFGFKGITPAEYAMTQPWVILHYLKLTVWPHPLCLDYQGWKITRTLTDSLPAAVPVVLLLVATGYGVIRKSWLGFLGAWFFIILSVTSSFIPIADVAFEHRMYLPLAAVVVLAVVGGSLAGDWIIGRIGWPRVVGERIGKAVVIGCVVLFGAMTVLRNQDYHSDLVIWGKVAGLYPESPRARVNVALALVQEGDDAAAAREWAECVRLFPNSATARSGYGLFLKNRGKETEALANLSLAVQLQPDLEVAGHQRGRLLLLAGRDEDALKQLRATVARYPRNAGYRFDLAAALRATGDEEQARAEVQEGLRLDPNWPRQTARKVRQNLARPSPSSLEVREALLSAREASMALDDQDPYALGVLARALAFAGRLDEALTTAAKAVARAEALGDHDQILKARETLQYLLALRVIEFGTRFML